MIVVLLIEYAKVLDIFRDVLDVRVFGSRHLLAVSTEHEFLWFLWLVLMLIALHLMRQGLFGLSQQVIYAKIVAGWALVIYLFEIAVATLKIVVGSRSYRIPWSLYVIGGGLIILALWRMPVLLLAAWKDKLEVKDYLTIVNSTRTILLQIIGGAIVIAGLYYTSQNMNIAQENVSFALAKEEADRLSQAINQLKDENSEVRLVAIRNLQSLATKSVSNYRLIRDIFRRYVRTHAVWRDTPDELNSGGEETRADIQSIIYFLGEWVYAAEAVKNDDERVNHDGDEYFLDVAAADRLMEKADLHATDLRGIDCSGTMRKWIFSSAHLEKSSLVSAALDEAVFDGANLAESDLANATLTSASLKGCNLSKTILRGVNFSNADIEGADFTDAVDLTVEQIRKTRNYDKAKLPPTLSAELKKDVP